MQGTEAQFLVWVTFSHQGHYPRHLLHLGKKYNDLLVNYCKYFGVTLYSPASQFFQVVVTTCYTMWIQHYMLSPYSRQKPVHFYS